MPEIKEARPAHDYEGAHLLRNAIEKLRLKLLDLTNKNRLLNFKFTETSRKFVRVIDASPTVLFDLLSTESTPPKKLYFVSLPEPDPEDQTERTGTFRAALAVARQTDANYVTATTLDPSAGNVGADEANKLEADLKSKVRRKLGMSERGDKAIRMNLADWAHRNGINPDYELGRSEASKSDREGLLQTLLLPDGLDRKLSGIREAANLAEQELGLSTLYAAIGFLEWFDEGDEERFAPLILVPVHMGREIKAGQYRYFVNTGDGADPIINITLRERLRRDHHIDVPELNDDESVESYLERFSVAIKDQRRWRIRRFVVVGHFSFARLAMFEDLDGEKWPDGTLFENKLLKSILDGSEFDEKEGSSEEFNVDDEEIESQVPVLITDADSSQFSAIVDAMGGRSFALKGPPGTGKSQTITNLIASALARGKRVLFVAEKMTALEVVAKRLREAGLGPYMLELHSTKIQKKRIMDSFADRLKIRVSARTSELEDTLKSLRVTRSELTRYVVLMNQKIGVTGSTLHHAYWEEQAVRRKLGGETCGILQSIQDPLANTVTAHELAERLGILNQFATHWSRCVVDGGVDLSKHPYAGIRAAVGSTFDYQSIRQYLSGWKESVDKISRSHEALCKSFKYAFPDTISYSVALAKSLFHLPGDNPNVDASLFRAMDTVVKLEAASALAEQLQNRNELESKVSEAFEQPEEILGNMEELEESVNRLNGGVELIDASDSSISSLAKAFRQEGVKQSGIARTFAVLKRVTDGANLTGPQTFERIKDALDAIKILKQLGPIGIQLRESGLYFESAKAAIEYARRESDAIKLELSRVGAIFNLSVLRPGSTLLQYAQALRSTGRLLSLISSKCREARQHFALATNGSKVNKDSIAAQFIDVSSVLERKSKFEKDARNATSLGASFSGLETDFKALQMVCDFSITVRRRFSSLDPELKAMSHFMLNGDSDLLCDLSEALDPDALEAAEAWLLSREGDPSCAAPEVLTSSITAIAEAAKACAALMRIRTRSPATADSWNQGIDFARALKAAVASIESHSLLAALGINPKSHSEHQANAVITATAESRLILELNLPQPINEFLLSSKYAAAQKFLRQWSAYVLREAGKVNEFQRALTQQWDLSVEDFFQPVGVSEPSFPQVGARLAQAIDASETTYQDWASFWRVRKFANERRLSGIVDAVISGRLAGDKVEDGYRYTYYRSLIATAHFSAEELPRWTGARLSELRKRVVELDLEYLRLGRQWLASVLSAIDVPRGNGRGPRKEWTERALIENEAAKSTKIIPIRKLLDRAGNAAKALKPCFMMSPASVAQYLSPKSNAFDLIVIDEASQMRPEEAIGTIARGEQIIVVGDPMQLPPTSFFDATDAQEMTEQEEDEELSIDNESILDQALGRLRPSRELRWHYRSRHESLIAFSNKEFYRGDLVVFPSPANKSDELGIEYVYVDKGRYRSSINPIEADVVVDRVASLMRTSPQRSIGVVAVNLPQKELLSAQFDRLFAEDPALEEYRLRHEESLEPFLIMSLENVQGHERDIVVISTVYGKAEDGGQVFQRFGPINSKVGHRRLNVLFTRAKEKVLLVTSLRSEDILIGPGSSAGVVALKGYLEFARSGRLEGGRSTGASFDSPFEKEVSDELLQAGYSCEPQVGVAGYFIDLAVRNPANRDHFMLAIECDGATYHSAKCARDRDRLRQKVLEGLGWEVYRIWSTDWFANRAREVQQLRRHLDALCAVRA